MIKKGDVIPVDIDDLAYGGQGVGRTDGLVVFVQGALPGDRVKARITKKQKNHAQALIKELERPSEIRIKPRCPIHEMCGGCCWQSLPYEEQLRFKGKQVEETLVRIGGLKIESIDPIIPSPETWFYRNKMEYTFGTDDQGQPMIGFHRPKRFADIFEVPRCYIHPKPFDALLATLTEYARKHDLKAYDQRTHDGFLRHAVMRHSLTNDKAVLVLMTHEGELPDPDGLIALLQERCPQIQGFVWGINRGVADVAVIEERRFEWGDPILKETVNGLTFNISPESFFQTNTAAGEKLYALTTEIAQLEPDDRLLDAYCGAGVIGLHCASQVDRVVGVEIIREAIWNARENAKQNGIKNATFIGAPMNQGLKLARSAAGGSFTKVIIDPPRGGMDKKSLAQLIELRAPVFVYVSCNPATLARDLQTLGQSGYEIERVQPVDMFPHTYHIETIVRLRLTDEPKPGRPKK